MELSHNHDQQTSPPHTCTCYAHLLHEWINKRKLNEKEKKNVENSCKVSKN